MQNEYIIPLVQVLGLFNMAQCWPWVCSVWPSYWVFSVWPSVGLGSVRSGPGTESFRSGPGLGLGLFGLAQCWPWVCSVWPRVTKVCSAWPIPESGSGIFSVCAHSTLCDPQLQNTCHYIVNQYVKYYTCVLGGANNMRPLSWGAQTEKIPGLFCPRRKSVWPIPALGRGLHRERLN